MSAVLAAAAVAEAVDEKPAKPVKWRAPAMARPDIPCECGGRKFRYSIVKKCFLCEKCGRYQ
jgi:hypothetical protein